MRHTTFAVGLLSILLVHGFATRAFAADEGNLTGHILRPRDSQPIADARVQITETGAKTQTDAQGAYSFSDLPPGVYTLVVTPSGGSPIQRKVTVTAGKTTQQDITAGPEMSALESITVLAQRTSETVAREAQLEAPKRYRMSASRRRCAAFPAFHLRPTRARGATSTAAASMPT